MSLPLPPSITKGQLALDPINGIVYYKDDNDNIVSTTWSWLQDLNNETNVYSDKNVSIDQDLTVGGDLVISGDTVSLNVSQILIEDNILVLNYNFSGSPILDAGIEVERGSENNVSIKWNESENKWQFTNDGITYLDLNSIIEDSVTLGLHTVGEYVKNITAGTGVTVSMPSGEGATPTISIGQDVSTTSEVIFATVTAENFNGDLTGNVTGDLTGNVTGDVTGDVTGNLTGDVTGNLTGNVTGNVTGNLTGNVDGDVTGHVSDISNHSISDLSDVSINDAANGDFLRYNGANWINDPVNLTTDTVGDYVATVSSGTGIAVSNLGGEGATPNISLNASLNDLNDVQVLAPFNGAILMYNGDLWTERQSPISEPMGFEERVTTSISFDNVTKTFTLTAGLEGAGIWNKGILYTYDSNEELTVSIPAPYTSGLYYIYIGTNGQLNIKNTYFTWDQDTPVAYVYWNNTYEEAFFLADERHGIVLDWATHEYLHRTRGAAIANGFGVNNYTITGDGTSDSHCQIDIADGTFFDEDLQIDITHSDTPTPNTWEQILQGAAEIPVFYLEGTEWVRDGATTFPLKLGSSRPQYNALSGSNWTTTDVANNHFGVSWIIATNNLNEPIIAILGQSDYGDKGAAEADFYNALDLTGFPIVEFRPLYKLIYECKDSYSNTPSAALVGVEDLRQVISAGQGVSAVAVSDHGSMTGLQDDDHPQYLLADGNRNALSLAVEGQLETQTLFVNNIEIDPSNPDDTNVLKYDAGLNKYIPGVASTVAALDDLTDVVITSATPNQVIKFDGENWVNAVSPSSVEGTTYFATIGNGIDSTFVINHGLSTRDVVVSLTETSSPYASFSTLWEATTLNAITIYFDAPPASNGIRVSIYAAVSGVAVTTDLDSLTDVALSDPANGDFLRYNGLSWINDPVNLSTDTIGDYVQALVAGTGVTITNNSGEGTTPTIEIGQDISVSATPNFEALNVSGWISSLEITASSVANLSTLFVDSIQINPSGASYGQGLVFNGTSFVSGNIAADTRDLEIKLAMNVE